MAPTVTRRTVTRTTHEGADELKRNISNIADEIGRVRDQARQEVDTLEKIRGMLDVGYLNDLLRSIETLEERIDELEGGSMEAREDADRLQRELEDEQKRLAKLWDAYKSQEDELQRVKRDYPLLEEKLFERERAIEGLRRELARLEPLAQYKDESEALASENRALQNELEQNEQALRRAERTVSSLEEKVDSLHAFEADAGRVKDLEKQLEEERERLAKLYRVYEDQEGEKKELEAALEQWRQWFNRMRPVFEETGKAPSAAPR